MFELQGKNNSAKVFTDNIDQKTIGQIVNMLNEDITKNTKVRIMPDTHYGKGCTIGTTIALPDDKSLWKVSPSIVGVDLSCGMMTYKVNQKVTQEDLKRLDEVINKYIPSGANGYGDTHFKTPNHKNINTVNNLINNLSFKIGNKERHTETLGTLGGGKLIASLTCKV